MNDDLGYNPERLQIETGSEDYELMKHGTIVRARDGSNEALGVLDSAGLTMYAPKPGSRAARVLALRGAPNEASDPYGGSWERAADSRDLFGGGDGNAEK